MTLQKKTIQRYRQLFPNETLREVSARTGIQITRVFRLFNGKTMKVGELEAFESAIMAKLGENSHFHRFQQLLEDASSVLTNEELGKISNYIERKIACHTFGRMYVSHQSSNANIVA